MAEAPSRSVTKATQRRTRAEKAPKTEGSVEFVTANIACVKSLRYPSGYDRAGKEHGPYYVLMGAELCHGTPSAEDDAALSKERLVIIKSGYTPPQTNPISGEEGTAKEVVFYTSSQSLLTPPYRVAVACTCPDWLLRNGMSLTAQECKPLKELLGETRNADNQFKEYKDADVGCKHMMLCNAELHRKPFITLGPSWSAEQKLKSYWPARPRKWAAASYQLPATPAHFDDGDEVVSDNE